MFYIHRVNARISDTQLRLRIWWLELQQALVAIFLNVKRDANNCVNAFDRKLAAACLTHPRLTALCRVLFTKPTMEAAIRRRCDYLNAAISNLKDYRELSHWVAQRGIRVDQVELSGGRGFKWVWRNEMAGHETHWIGLFDSMTDAFRHAKASNGTGVAINGAAITLVLDAVRNHASPVQAYALSDAGDRQRWCRAYRPHELATIAGILLTKGQSLSDSEFPSGGPLHALLCRKIADLMAAYCGGKVVDIAEDGTVVVEGDSVLPQDTGIWRYAGHRMPAKTEPMETNHGV